MKRRWLEKICEYFCFTLFLFVICQNSICLASEEELEELQAGLIREGLNYDSIFKIEGMSGGTAEPGFDFDEQEMANLKIWPRGYIPYYIDGVSFDNKLNLKLRTILEVVNSITGVKFTELSQPPESDDDRWVFFINRRGVLPCEDYTTNSFTNHGVQKVVLGYECFSRTHNLGGTILGILGIPPQHNAPNRNEYIEVKEENILPDKVHLFKMLNDGEWLFHDIEYDILSAGHFHFHQYTNNGSATIVPKSLSDGAPIGEGDGLTFADILKIRMVYNYISRQRRARTSDCSKLFKPGRGFKKYTPKDTNIPPRQKPDKYSAASKNAEGGNKLKFAKKTGKKKSSKKLKLENMHDYDTYEK